MRVLVVEDEPEMAQLLAKGLREEQCEISIARDGCSALEKSQQGLFDVILLDVMLPQINGLEVAKRLRQREQETPVLMLTARDSVPDIISGLNAGADDYLTKPFSFLELLARMRALVRRHQARRKNVLEIADLLLDVTSFRAFRKGQEIHLSNTEYRLLELLVRNAGRVVSRNEILASIWGHGREVTENTLDAFVRLLRKKIDQDSTVRLIHTHRGFGYSASVANSL
jgi:DNA-binding response OmpR family regulator